MRRTVEIIVCVLFVLFLSIAAAKPGSSYRCEEGQLYIFCSVLLMLFASFMTWARRDLWFRLALYPLALLAGLALLVIDIQRAYGYERDHFWKTIPLGVVTALLGALYVFTLNGALPFLWRKLRKHAKTSLSNRQGVTSSRISG